MMCDGRTWPRFIKLKSHKARITMCCFDQKGLWKRCMGEWGGGGGGLKVGI